MPKWPSGFAQGVASAQYNLGVFYAKGQGVPRNDVEAIRWYLLAANQGVANAQENLAIMYSLGQGVPQDYVTAHMWFNLAAAKGNQAGLPDRDLAAAKMTPNQIAEAQRLAHEWKPK